MLAHPSLVLLAGLASPCVAMPSVDAVTYYANLASNLTAVGLDSFLNALVFANRTETGAKLINALYSDGEFTIYAPVDDAWTADELADLPDNHDLTSLLAYHIVTANLPKSDVADPRQHTIALTALKTDDMKLPGDQTQVLVLESAPDGRYDQQGDVVLIRGDTWNASSVGNASVYENLRVLPIDRVLHIPATVLETVSRPYLALAAMSGAKSYLATLEAPGLNDAMADCDGCTFFVPVDAAFEAITDQIASLDTAQKINVIKNHVLNGTVAYSPRIDVGSTFITAAGQTLLYAANSSGNYFSIGDSAAQIVRADIPVSIGVVHLIDHVLVNSNYNEDQANEAVSSASDAATAVQGGVTGSIGIATATRVSSSLSGPSGSGPSGAATNTPGAGAARWDTESSTKLAFLSIILGAIWV